MEQIELLRYIEKRDVRIKKVFEECYSLRISLADTLEDDFQIVCEILRVFEKYADGGRKDA